MHCPLMDSRDIQILETGSVAEVSRVLQHFNSQVRSLLPADLPFPSLFYTPSQHNSSFSFSGISAASKKVGFNLLQIWFVRSGTFCGLPEVGGGVGSQDRGPTVS